MYDRSKIKMMLIKSSGQTVKIKRIVMNLKNNFWLLILTIALKINAQLSVHNSNYVYVSDQVVFVEENINLQHTVSYIYLRNEGQLIQGSGTIGNTGQGKLSLYQNGNVGAYEYNYWCAPVGNTNASNTNNSFGITLLNDITGLTTAIPATTIHANDYNGTASPLNIEPYWIWKFIASNTYASWVHVQENITINPGEGFTMKGTSGTSANNPGDNQNYDFRGKPNTGTIMLTVANDQFTLTGNPYPSALDAVAYLHDSDNTTNITGTLYYWEQDPDINSHNLGDYDGGYASYTIDVTGTIETYVPAVFYTYNGDGSINGNGSGGPSGKMPKRYIPIGQGFMVRGAASGVVRVKNSHRVFQKESGGNSEFFKQINEAKNLNTITPGFQAVPNTAKRFRLNIDFNDTYTRQIVQTFTDQATEGFDYGLESGLTDQNPKEAFWPAINGSLVAQALGYDQNANIPLGIYVDEQSNIRIRITDVQHFEETQPIYLYDQLNNTYTNLQEQNFNVVLEAGNHDNRFMIVFTQETLSVPHQEIEMLKVWYKKQESSIIVHNPDGKHLSKIQVYDITGKRVFTNNDNITQNYYKIPVNNWSMGVYIISLTINNKACSKKVMVTH